MARISGAPRVRYVVDSSGRRSSVLMSLREYKRLLEQVEQLADIQALEAAIDGKPRMLPLREALSARAPKKA
jgi:hypothetical protein